MLQDQVHRRRYGIRRAIRTRFWRRGFLVVGRSSQEPIRRDVTDVRYPDQTSWIGNLSLQVTDNRILGYPNSSGETGFRICSHEETKTLGDRDWFKVLLHRNMNPSSKGMD